MLHMTTTTTTTTDAYDSAPFRFYQQICCGPVVLSLAAIITCHHGDSNEWKGRAYFNTCRHINVGLSTFPCHRIQC